MARQEISLNVNDYLLQCENKQHEYCRRTIADRQKTVSNSLLGLQLLAGEGFTIDEPRHYLLNYPEFAVANPTDFQKIHRALGGLKSYGSPVPVGDGRSRTIKVQLCPKDPQFEHFVFSYKKKLPKGEKAKCKIKTVIHKEKVLVCE